MQFRRAARGPFQAGHAVSIPAARSLVPVVLVSRTFRCSSTPCSGGCRPGVPHTCHKGAFSCALRAALLAADRLVRSAPHVVRESSVRAALIYQHATRDRDQAIAKALGTPKGKTELLSSSTSGGMFACRPRLIVSKSALSGGEHTFPPGTARLPRGSDLELL
jgi:hypothetical protein